MFHLRTSESAEFDGFKVRCERDGPTVVVTVFGELDLASCPTFEQALERAQRSTAETVVVDLSGLDMIDSCGLTVLVRAAARAKPGALAILRGPRRVHRVFEITGLDAGLPFVD